MGGQAVDEYEEVEWTPYADVVLLNALVGLRPVGINYQFCMLAVWSRFARAMGKNVSFDTVEKRLANFYDFEAANGIVDETLFDNHQQDFALPSSDFPEVANLLKEKELPPLTRNALKNAAIAVESSKTPPAAKLVKKTEPRTSEKPRRSVVEDDKKTPAKKRRASERTTPAPKRSRI